MLCICCCAAPVYASPVIRSLSPTTLSAGNVAVITGNGFGSAQGAAEVVAIYGDSFAYVLMPQSWTNNTITVRIPDPGKSLAVSLQVRRGKQRSNSQPLQLIPLLQSEHSPVYEHHLNVGDKGEDVWPVQNRVAACGQTGEQFASADIEVEKRRFADVQLVAMPDQGCERCKPLTARWFNEPTGYITYQMYLNKRITEGVCPARIRRVK